MLDEEKVSLDVSAYPSLAEALVGVFDSQISGGKRYDLATRGAARLTRRTFRPVNQIKPVNFLWPWI